MTSGQESSRPPRARRRRRRRPIGTLACLALVALDLFAWAGASFVPRGAPDAPGPPRALARVQVEGPTRAAVRGKSSNNKWWQTIIFDPGRPESELTFLEDEQEEEQDEEEDEDEDEQRRVEEQRAEVQARLRWVRTRRHKVRAADQPAAGGEPSGEQQLPTANSERGLGELESEQEAPGSPFDGEHSSSSSSWFGAEGELDPSESGQDHLALAAANGEHCDTIEDIIATRPSQTVGLLFGINYLIIFILGLLGNVITLYVLACKGKKRSAQDVLIGNLACSDIMLCVFAVPITPKYLIRDGHWTLGPALCKVVSFAQSTSVYMSTYSLICIGYIRYRLIVHPLENAMSKRAALLYCLGTWLISLVVTVPYMLQVRLAPEHCAIKFCDEAWEKPHLRFIFSLFTALFQFLIPLGSVGFFNKKIYSRLDGRLAHADAEVPSASNSQHAAGHHLQHNLSHHEHSQHSQAPAGGKRRGTLKTGEQHDTPTSTGGHKIQPGRPAGQHHPTPSGVMAIKEYRQREKEKRMRKANNRLIFVVVIFAHSWLPLNLFNMIQDYFDEITKWTYLTTTFLVVHQIACSSVIWNPILYAWMSETYRQELRCALPKFIAAKFSSCLSEPPGAHSTGASYHGPGSTSVITMNNNNNNKNESSTTNNSNSNHNHNKNPVGPAKKSANSRISQMNNNNHLQLVCEHERENSTSSDLPAGPPADAAAAQQPSELQERTAEPEVRSEPVSSQNDLKQAIEREEPQGESPGESCELIPEAATAAAAETAATLQEQEAR